MSVVRDDLHAGRVCHRDLKGENILVNPDTGDILLLGTLELSSLVREADRRPRPRDALLGQRAKADDVLRLARLPLARDRERAQPPPRRGDVLRVSLPLLRS